MTEQEWLEHQADQWMRDRNITPAFNPALPAASECGSRVVLDRARSAESPLERITAAKWVEFYAVFDGREVTTRRLASDIAALP
jgi:hypothetical protein